MIELSTAQLTAWVGSFLFPFFRVAAFFMAMPMIGTRLVPARIRLAFAVVVTLAIAPVLPAMPVVEGVTFAAYLLIAQQIIIGVAMGFILQLLFQAFILAGQMISMQMGLGFASLADPVNGVSVAAVGQFYLMLVMLLFLSMNGHLVVFEVMVESFRTMPVAMVGFDTELFYRIAIWGVWMFAAAVVVSLPAVTAILIVNFAFGVMNRAAPQLNIFSLGFPFTMLFGLVIVFISLSGFLPQYESITAEGLVMLRQYVNAQ